MESFELRVKILLVVFRVSVSVQSNLVLIVRSYILQLHSVPTKDHVWLFQWNLLIVEHILSFKLIVINMQFRDCHGLRVDEELTIVRHIFQIEVYDCVSNIVVSFIQSKLEIILNVLQQSFSRFSLFFCHGDGRLELFIDKMIITEML